MPDQRPTGLDAILDLVDLDQLRELELKNRASHGYPWWNSYTHCGVMANSPYHGEPYSLVLDVLETRTFLIALRNAAPLLLEAVKERDDLRHEVESLKSQIKSLEAKLCV